VESPRHGSSQPRSPHHETTAYIIESGLHSRKQLSHASQDGEPPDLSDACSDEAAQVTKPASESIVRGGELQDGENGPQTRMFSGTRDNQYWQLR
jgi:hypothetical protein